MRTKGKHLRFEHCESRILLAVDVAVSVEQVSSDVDSLTYEVSVSNDGTLPVTTRVFQTGGRHGRWQLSNPFPDVVDLDSSNSSGTTWSADGHYGYAIWGSQISEMLGIEIRTGDINADGIDDMLVRSDGIIEAPGDFQSKLTYVVFGTVDERMDGRVSQSERGFSFETEEPADVGDFNGDGVADIVFSRREEGEGRSYVVFGHEGIGSLIDDPELLDGSNGFTIFDTNSRFNSLHLAENAGDINGDGIEDLFVSATSTEGSDQFGYVYGRENHAATFDTIDLDGTDGSIWEYNSEDGDLFGGFSAVLGDVNGDGIDDRFVGSVGKILLGSNQVMR